MESFGTCGGVPARHVAGITTLLALCGAHFQQLLLHFGPGNPLAGWLAVLLRGEPSKCLSTPLFVVVVAVFFPVAFCLSPPAVLLPAGVPGASV